MNRKIVLGVLVFTFLGAQTTEEIKKKVKESGLPESQVREILKQRGYTDKQIEAEAKKRGIEVGEQAEGETPILMEEVEISDIDITVEEVPIIEPEVLEEEELALEAEPQPGRPPLSYFGYDIFRRDPELFQASTFGAVDPDYNIGPMDEIIFMLWGETQFRQVFTVDREGFIFIPEIGQVFVNGLTLGHLEKKLFRVLSQSYATLNPISRKPTTFLDVSLGNLRPLRILVLGEVAQPGAYTVSPSTALFTSLYYFNGPTTLGSLRDIRLIRDGKQIATVDFYDYLLTGQKVSDVRLQLDDTIFLPTRGKTVSISGEINRPAIYELKESEGLLDLIEIAGDLKVTAYLDRVQIDRIVPFDKRTEIGMDRMYVDVSLQDVLEGSEDFDLMDGDQIQVFSVLDLRKNIVIITGAVERPGTYDIGDSLRLSELIEKANSLLGDAYLERVDVVRIRPDFTEELIKLNLGAALIGESNHDIHLQPLDRVHVYSLSEMIPKKFVTISGHVKNPGRYQLLNNMTLNDLIFKGGGFLDEQWRDNTYLERADLLRYDADRVTQRIIPFNLGEVLDNPESVQDFALLPGDEVRVYSQAVFNAVKPVTIDGVVKNVGQYSLKTGMTIKDLILEAGGLSENVYRYKIEVARVDPNKVDVDTYAEVITLDMDDEYSIINVNYQYIDNPGEITIDRKEFSLEPYDYVSIRPDPYFRLQRKVTVNGAVNYPGTYTILHPSEKVTDIIRRAGGLRPEAYPRASQITRAGKMIKISFEEIIKKPKSKMNFEVLDGDEIIIAVRPHIVQVTGEVNSPGYYKFVPGANTGDYLDMAGGFTRDADRGNMWIEYPGGISKKIRRYFLPRKVEDGSIIVVAKEEETEPLDKTEFAKEIASILADFATVIAIIFLATGRR